MLPRRRRRAMPSSSEVATARPAARGRRAARASGRRFVREAAERLPRSASAANGERANAKSILDVLGLGATGGTELVISASGADAAEALERLSELVCRPHLSERARARRPRREPRRPRARGLSALRGKRPDDAANGSMRAGATLSSSTPSPTKRTTSSGTPAASPQTSTVIPTSWAAWTTDAT